ncbi:hypothetical protein TSUD_174210 [Trifolium subterraneum]|nr:hypothetical protein TSUD_174210 [Trifolium subterraneum]
MHIAETIFNHNSSLFFKVGMTKSDAAVQTLSDINPDIVLESYTLNITIVDGFETFMSSLKNKSFCPNKHGSSVDLVLSCVDNYEARMAVNQACNELSQTWLESGKHSYLESDDKTLVFLYLSRDKMLKTGS